MAFANWKVAIFYETVLRLSCSLHVNPITPMMTCVRIKLCCDFQRPKILKFREGCVHTSIIYWRFAFVFRIVALEYWCLGVSLLSGVLGKLIRAVSIRRQLAEIRKEVSSNTLHHHFTSNGPCIIKSPILRQHLPSDKRIMFLNV